MHKYPSNMPDRFIRDVRRNPGLAIFAAHHHQLSADRLASVQRHVHDWKTKVYLAGLVRHHRENAQFAWDVLGGLGRAKDLSCH